MLVLSVSKMTCFYYQNYDNYFVYEHDFESPWFWGNSYRAFSLPKQWNRGHVQGCHEVLKQRLHVSYHRSSEIRGQRPHVPKAQKGLSI